MIFIIYNDLKSGSYLPSIVKNFNSVYFIKVGYYPPSFNHVKINSVFSLPVKLLPGGLDGGDAIISYCFLKMNIILRLKVHHDYSSLNTMYTYVKNMKRKGRIVNKTKKSIHQMCKITFISVLGRQNGLREIFTVLEYDKSICCLFLYMHTTVI